MTSCLHRSRLSTPPIKDALEHLASIDLLELCNEAKTEHCRATRDLSSCGRCVQNVLNSCGHASLCEECSKRCDVCPICRTSLPANGNRLRPRLYYECVNAGLISKRYADNFPVKDDCKDHDLVVQRLYSLFDVALDNNLVSLICHYVTDVCMDESAVSSDPVLSFLLDGVVVKDWCKQRLKGIIRDLQLAYRLDLGEMKSNLCSFQKFASQLAGLSNVLDVMVSSFKDNLSAMLNNLHCLLSNILKAKQHLEAMIWCIQHEFLENVRSCYPDYQSWVSQVHERKSAVINQSWSDSSSYLAYYGGRSEPALFIEQALSNLDIEEYYGDKYDEIDILCLQDEHSPKLFSSKINESYRNGSSACYPFKNARAAADVIFLHGASDMVVAKRAIFLYYLFDRHWTLPDAEWRYIVDDFSSSFSISRLPLLESLVFYLLDNHSDEALQEACTLLPEIAGLDTHPKIAQVLLERKRPDMALTVLRCNGLDGFSGYYNSKDDGGKIMSLEGALTVLRVRTECGLLTEAFMCQRVYCNNLRESTPKHLDLSPSTGPILDSWLLHMEILVTEMCLICMRKHLADRMIELPWDSTEEKYVHKCLLEGARQSPSSICGSLLTVFYLQRYRYIEACQVHHELQRLEESFKNLEGDIASQMKSISLWRSTIVEKALDLLPEVQRKQVISESAAEIDHSSSQDDQMEVESTFEAQQKNLASTSSRTSLSLVQNTDPNIFLSKKPSIGTSRKQYSHIGNAHMDISRGLLFQQGHLINGGHGSRTMKKPNDSISGSMKTVIHDQQLRGLGKRNESFVITSKDSTEEVWSFEQRDSPAELLSIKHGSRWRSDETGEDEADPIDRSLFGRPIFTRGRQTRRFRRI